MNIKKSILFLCAGIFLISSLSCREGGHVAKSYNAGINIIPTPRSLEKREGSFKLSDGVSIGAITPEAKKIATYFAAKISLATGYDVKVEDKGEITLVLDSCATFSPEGYALDVESSRVQVTACSPRGLFYGMQSFLQLLPAEIESAGIVRDVDWEAPAANIIDSPRFAYRGIHMDPCRHFMTVEEVKKQIDVLSMFKINTIHWHLTDDQGWRIEIKQYPGLAEIGGRRIEGEGVEYGPFYYTQEEIKDIVSYAAERFITIIPELEIPGHELAAISAYPGLSCKGDPVTPRNIWGVEDIVMCPGKESVFTFLENVIDEMVALFPGTYFHIGGDECPKESWKSCPLCQKRILEEGIKPDGKHTSEQLLHTYVVERIGKYLARYDKKIIGWDEILEGGLAPEATVMSWRGEEGGIKSARMGHDVVMTPGGYMYFDFYQADPKTQPYAIGGYTPIKRAYSYNPVPVDSLTAEESKHILGVQANTWTEYIKDEKHLEYMMFPRALAVAEIGWTPQEDRSWEDFKPRMNANIPVLQRMGIHTFTLSDEIETTMKVDTLRREIKVMLDAEKYPAEIRYTTDGSIPTASSRVYDGPIVVKDSADIKAAIFRDGQLQGTPTEKKVDYHRGINKPIHYNSKLYSGYMAGGMNALLDGYRGGLTYLDGRWQGYLNDLDCVVDMGEVTDIHKVSSRFMQLIGPGVYQPGEVELLTSEDGESYISQGVIPTTISNTDKDLSFQEYTFNGDWKARYIRIKAKEANKGFIFTDEIVIW